MKKVLPVVAFRRLEALYDDMRSAYDKISGELGLTCSGCPDNCCTSFFQHHTYIEWAYLWRGLSSLSQERQDLLKIRAKEYMEGLRFWVAGGQQGSPGLMCPLNENGLCALYGHRMMICRLHGVPNKVHMPDGRIQDFPGCFKSRELVANFSSGSIPTLDRTDFYRRLAIIERDFVGLNALRSLARIKLTLSEFILAGPPKLRIF
ncbi:MAG: hypothetical protein EOM25_00085 [Deltaproteobacteria bacterium]|nr:hypothetical protein [Deltaproteobacteria bacterium]